ncbi:hypothetical protein HanPI659440_Chr08g0285121 [Helianthus annuus]|nr:hypothetical protein HanPI659440_Chr08g0285121 [Helianthus annuus]
MVPMMVENGNRGGPSKAADSHIQAGRLYSHVVGNTWKSQDQQDKVIVVNSDAPAYPVHCAGRSVVGTSRSLRALSCVEQVLHDGGFSGASMSYVGGMRMMITFKNRSVANDFIASGDLWRNIFTRVNIWNGEDFPFDRIIFLRIRGVPFHLRDNSVFDQIGVVFGEVVKPSEFSWESVDNADGCCGVLTSIGNRIEDKVVIQWKGKQYQVWVSEDSTPWVPDFSGSQSGNVSDFLENSGVMPKEVDMEEGEIRCDMPESDLPGGRKVDHKGVLEDERVVSQQSSINSGAWGLGGHGEAVQPSKAPTCINDGDEQNAADACSGGGGQLDSNDNIISGGGCPMNLHGEGMRSHVGDVNLLHTVQCPEINDNVAGTCSQSSDLNRREVAEQHGGGAQVIDVSLHGEQLGAAHVVGTPRQVNDDVERARENGSGFFSEGESDFNIGLRPAAGLEQDGPCPNNTRPSYITCRLKRGKKPKKNAQALIIPDLNQEPEGDGD